MANDNMITLRKSMGHLKILREFLDSKGGYRDINHIPPLELDSHSPFGAKLSLEKLCCELTHKKWRRIPALILRGMFDRFERHIKRHRNQYSLITIFKLV